MTRTRLGLVSFAFLVGTVFLGIGLALPAFSQSLREFPLATASATATGIAAGPDGALWFTEYDGNQIGRMTTAGAVTEFPVPTAASGPNSICAGPDGALWFTEFDKAKIGRITKAGVITEFPMAASHAPDVIVSGPDGALWFTDPGTNEIGRVTTAGVFTGFPVLTASSLLVGITVGPDGNLWFAERSGNRVGRITPAGAVTEFPLPNASSAPVFIASGSDGNLWFTENLGNRIGRITTAGSIIELTIPSATSKPGGIASGPDGNLWFVEEAANKVARLTTAGTFTEFPIPTLGSNPIEIRGFDGALWFVEANTDQIGRISVGDVWPISLKVDTTAVAGSLSFVNGILEPGETVLVKPTLRNDTDHTAQFSGLASNPTGPPGGLYGMPDLNAEYTSFPMGTTTDCGSDCYLFQVSNPVTRPVLHWDASFMEQWDATAAPKVWSLHIGNTFSDVVITSPFYKFIETMVHNNVTAGCGGTTYCPSASTTRQQMAVFAVVSKGPAGYTPPACGTPMFGDVPAASPFCKWIEELARRGVVSGCGGGNYCPGTDVTRQQMAVFALATLEGNGFTPPACGTPMFGDVPASSGFCKWIEELARRGVVSGCGGGNYCPTSPVTREQMSVFLTVTFGLTLYGP